MNLKSLLPVQLNGDLSV